MNNLNDTLLIIGLKLILMIGFIALMKFWIKKKSSIFPKIVYGIFGIVFVLFTSSSILDWVLNLLFAHNISLIDKQSINSFSVLGGLVIYFYFGWNVLNIGKSK